MRHDHSPNQRQHQHQHQRLDQRPDLRPGLRRDQDPDRALRQEIADRIAAVEAAAADLSRTDDVDDIELLVRLGIVAHTAALVRRVRVRLAGEAARRGIHPELVTAVTELPSAPGGRVRTTTARCCTS